MFFKSRVGRDIDRFAAEQEKAAQQQAKRAERPEQESVTTSNSVATQPAPTVVNQTVDTAVLGPKNRTGEQQQSMVGADATWEGKIRTEGSARIEGQLSGEVEAGETVYIEKGARVRANIHARRVIIGGDMEGEIECREQMVVQRTGRLGGQASTRTLIIEEGAIVHSQIKMLRDEKPATPRATDAIPLRELVALGAVETDQRPHAEHLRESGSIAVEQDREERA